MTPHEHRGRKACILSAFHQGQIAAGRERAQAMDEMRRQGMTQAAIARAFGITESGVRSALRRYRVKYGIGGES